MVRVRLGGRVRFRVRVRVWVWVWVTVRVRVWVRVRARVRVWVRVMVRVRVRLRVRVGVRVKVRVTLLMCDLCWQLNVCLVMPRLSQAFANSSMKVEMYKVRVSSVLKAYIGR